VHSFDFDQSNDFETQIELQLASLPNGSFQLLFVEHDVCLYVDVLCAMVLVSCCNGVEGRILTRVTGTVSANQAAV
jgi:hypothetical protein